MYRLTIACLLAMATLPAQAEPPPAGFRKLGGAEIKRAFAGHTFTDEVHFSFRYRPAGVLDVTSMGKKAARKWRVAGDELCATDEFGETCFEIWKKESAISMRPKSGALSIDGVLK